MTNNKDARKVLVEESELPSDKPVLMLAISPYDKDFERKSFAPLEDAVTNAQIFGQELQCEMLDLYETVSIHSIMGPYIEGIPLQSFVVNHPSDHIITVVQLYAELYNPDKKDSKRYTPVARVDMVVDDLSKANQLISRIFDRIVFRKRIRFEGDGSPEGMYALLTNTSNDIERDYLRDEEVFKKIAYPVENVHILK